MPISAFMPLCRHTFCYIKPQIQQNKLWDIPSFSHTLSCPTNYYISWDIPTFSFSSIRNQQGHFLLHSTYLPSFCKRTIGTPFITSSTKKTPGIELCKNDSGYHLYTIRLFLFTVSSTTIPKRDTITVILRNSADSWPYLFDA